ncbi:MAG: TIGR01777 family oxidoreductase, partial [Vulcanimicrobiaceae bacterium]
LADLHAAGHRVVALSRNPDAAVLSDVDVVVHLAGEPIAGRWTAGKKHAISASRIEGTRRLVATLAAAARRPSLLLCASAVGYYGSRGDEPLTESAAAGDDFLARVCVEWEAAARDAERLGMRTVTLRFGIVLGNGGALAMMKRPFLIGLGGPLGSGKQYLPWVHIDDLTALCAFVIERAQVAGPLNVVSPDYVTNAQFSRALGAVLQRPSFVPAPAFAMRAALGEFADTLLASQLVIPEAAQRAGFAWKHPKLEDALRAILRR